MATKDKIWSRYFEMGSVGLLQVERMGRPGLVSLCILGSKYMVGVRGVRKMRLLEVGFRAEVETMSWTVEDTRCS